MIRVLSICGDPGGAAAIAPVLLRLSHVEGAAMHALAYGKAPAVLTREGVPHEVLFPSATLEDLSAQWDGFAPDVLLTGTSVNEFEYEKVMIRFAAERNVPSLAVLDFWSGYDRRFGPRRGVFDALPDRVAVMDERAAIECKEAGITADRIVITGQPAFDGLAARKRSYTEGERLAIREHAGVSPSEWMTVFISQPLRALTRDPDSGYRNPGYNEYGVATLLEHALKQAAGVHRGRGSLIVRPHPREEWEHECPNSEWVRSKVVQYGDTRDLMLAADLVVGMTSVALVEASCLGCLTLSLQPGDPQPTALPGGCVIATRVEEIPAIVGAMLFDEVVREEYRRRSDASFSDGKATDRVLELLLGLTKGVCV